VIHTLTGGEDGWAVADAAAAERAALEVLVGDSEAAVLAVVERQCVPVADVNLSNLRRHREGDSSRDLFVWRVRPAVPADRPQAGVQETTGGRVTAGASRSVEACQPCPGAA
jgi:hypothetical protein